MIAMVGVWRLLAALAFISVSIPIHEQTVPNTGVTAEEYDAKLQLCRGASGANRTGTSW
jgi:hypothetical protein